MTHDLQTVAAGSSTARGMLGDAIRNLLAGCPVMPILTVHDVSSAAALARALVAGGIHIFEVLMPTNMACDTVAEMRAARAAVPEAVVGMGTLLTPDAVDGADAVAYLQLPNCTTVGSSWVAPPDMVRARDWDGIGALARSAVSLTATTPPA